MEVYGVLNEVVGYFRVGDIISFDLKDGEPVEALAVKDEGDGMVFVLLDCLREGEKMNTRDTSLGGYAASSLRLVLNSKILNRFPEYIRDKMMRFPDGNFIRIPTEYEIFGRNTVSIEEEAGVTQWEPMKLLRNRIALKGKNGPWTWYWLQNKASAAGFALVGSGGLCSSYGASSVSGVRPAFKYRKS